MVPTTPDQPAACARPFNAKKTMKIQALSANPKTTLLASDSAMPISNRRRAPMREPTAAATNPPKA